MFFNSKSSSRSIWERTTGIPSMPYGIIQIKAPQPSTWIFWALVVQPTLLHPRRAQQALVVLKILKAGMWFVSSLRGQKSLQIGFWEQSSYWPVLFQRSLLLCWIWYLDRILQGCMVWAHLGSSFREISKQKMPSVDVMGVADIPSELSTCLWVAKRFD